MPLASGSPSFELFSPHNNPLIDLGLKVDVSYLALGIGAAALAALLGYVAYTDMFCGRRIPNNVTIPMFFANLVISLFIFENPANHLLIASAVIVLIFIIFLIGAFAEGDLKLYSAFAVLLAQGALVMMFISWIVIILYSIPTMIKSTRAPSNGRRGGKLGSSPAGPGIALSFPLFLLFAGVSISQFAILVIIEAVAFSVCKFSNVKLPERDDFHSHGDDSAIS